MTNTRTCSRCRRPLPDGDAACPHCLLELGLALPPRDPDAASSAGAPSEPAGQGDAASASAATRPGAEIGPAAGRSALDAPPPAEIAARFPGLEILECIGQGGMGVVYKARQKKLDRLVALKVLAPQLSRDPAFAERFLREARALARLSHPSIVAVYDFGETEGLCWLVMEYVDGVDLRRVLRAGKFEPRHALKLVPRLCDALAHAHELGIVHRDVKPENLLLARDGSIKIVDFGLAKLVGDRVGLTATSQAMGTPHYMAPEQLRASHDVDHRADLFSLGVVFYEMLTGALPLGRFEPPSAKADVDTRVDEIVLHALEHEPERRYQHATELKHDVETLELRPGADATRPGADATRPGADATRTGAEATRPGAEATRPGADATRTGAEATRPGADATRPGADATLTGAAAAVAATPVHAASRAQPLGARAWGYASVWAVVLVALSLEVSASLQLLLAGAAVALGAPYLAVRALRGRGTPVGSAFTYGFAACGAAASAVGAFWPLDLLQRLVPRGGTLAPDADTTFVAALCAAIAVALGVLASRARRRLGPLPWKHFANFALDALVWLSALAVGLIVFGFVTTVFGPRSDDLAWLEIVRPLLVVGFVGDLVAPRLRREPLRESVSPRESVAHGEPARSESEPNPAAAARRRRRAIVVLSLVAVETLAGAFAARRLLEWSFEERELGVLVACVAVTVAWVGVLAATAALARSRAECARPRFGRRAAAILLAGLACLVLGRALVGVWERDAASYASDALTLRERVFEGPASAATLERAGFDPREHALDDPGLDGRRYTFAAAGEPEERGACRALYFAGGSVHPLVLVLAAAWLFYAAGRLFVGSAASAGDAVDVAPVAALGVPLVLVAAAGFASKLDWFERAEPEPRATVEHVLTSDALGLETEVTIGGFERALERVAAQERALVVCALRAPVTRTADDERVADFFGARVEPRSCFSAWAPTPDGVVRREPAVLVEAFVLDGGRAGVRLDFGRVRAEQRPAFEALAKRWSDALAAELALER